MVEARGLLPCPFCGGTPKVVDYYGNYNRPPDWCVHCESCDLALDGDKTPEEAVVRWNRRVPPPGSRVVPEGAVDAETVRKCIEQVTAARRTCRPAWQALEAHDDIIDALRALAEPKPVDSTIKQD